MPEATTEGTLESAARSWHHGQPGLFGGSLLQRRERRETRPGRDRRFGRIEAL